MASSTLRRRVRARMKKTGEGHQAALRNYLKSHPKKDNPQPVAAASSAASAPRPPVFRISFPAGLFEVRPVAPPPTPEEKAAQKERLWAHLERAIRKQFSPRAARTVADDLRQNDWSAEELRSAVNYLAALPQGYFGKIEEEVARQMRELRPLLDQAAAIPQLARQTHEIWKAAEAARPVIAAAMAQEAAIGEALREFERGPVAAALRYANEGPFAEARRFRAEGVVDAALRLAETDVVAAALRRFGNDAGL
jgi:hypothetical protein